MEFDEIIRERHSTREFSNRKPDWRDVLEALDATQNVPFANNFNNLKYVIIEDRDNIDKIAEWSQQTWMNQVHMLVIVAADERHLESIYGERGRVYSKHQAGAAIQTFLLKLTELGLQSCWVGAYDDEKIKGMIRCPGWVQIEAVIPIGYEQKARFAKKTRKRELTRSIYWEVWERGRRAPIFFEAPKSRDPWK